MCYFIVHYFWIKHHYVHLLMLLRWLSRLGIKSAPSHLIFGDIIHNYVHLTKTNYCWSVSVVRRHLWRGMFYGQDCTTAVFSLSILQSHLSQGPWYPFDMYH